MNHPNQLVHAARLLAAAIVVGCLGPNVRADHGEGDSNSARTEPAPIVKLGVQTSNPQSGPKGDEFYVRLRLQADEVETEKQPMNVALVFDRSGSMKEEGKIDYLRKAGHLVADNLTRSDFVAMVAYNHEVRTLVPMHPVVNREYLHHRIDELYAEGYTNISGGLLEGCAEVRKRLREPGLHHVILLTDGLANRGVTDVDQLVNLVRRCTQDGITVSTVGLGTEYNEDLLSRMSQAGGGRYHYVANGEDLPKTFERELGALLQSVAQNGRLKLHLPDGVKLVSAFGYEIVHTPEMPPHEREVRLGDLASGDERVVLLKFRQSTTRPVAARDGFDVPISLQYDDVPAARRFELDATASIVPVRGEATDQTEQVTAYAELVEGLDTIALAVSSMDRKVASAALDIRDRRYPDLKAIAWASRDQDFVNKAFLFEHYSRELEDLIDHGALHEHSTERAKLQKELHYRRFLMQHHHDHKH
jgi:Ca-activated chloride channel family protein